MVRSVKLFYTISEVSEMVKVSPTVLRYWESRFDILKPRKNRRGLRMYTLKDIETIKTIYKLLKIDNLSFERATEEINNIYKKKKKAIVLSEKEKMFDKEKIIDKLIRIRFNLEELLKELE